MELTTREIIFLFRALSELAGAPTVVLNERGQKVTVREPYDIGPKFKWNAAKNRSILRRHVEDHDEQTLDFTAQLQKFRRDLQTNDDPKENMRKVEMETERVNNELRALEKQKINVEGLLKLHATGLNLRTSRIPPTLIEELMPLIEGEPDFDKEDKKP